MIPNDIVHICWERGTSSNKQIMILLAITDHDGRRYPTSRLHVLSAAGVLKGSEGLVMYICNFEADSFFLNMRLAWFLHVWHWTTCFSIFCCGFVASTVCVWQWHGTQDAGLHSQGEAVSEPAPNLLKTGSKPEVPRKLGACSTHRRKFRSFVGTWHQAYSH